MRIWLKWVLAPALLLVLLFGSAAALFFMRPGVFLTSRLVGAVLKRSGAVYAPHWSNLRFSAEALELRRHRYALSATDFCVNDRPGVFKACFSDLEVSVVVLYTWHGPIIEHVERLVAVSEGARLDLRRRVPGGNVLPPLWLAAVRSFRIELSRLTLVSSTTVLSGGFQAVLSTANARPLSVSADLLTRGPAGDRRLKVEFAAKTDLLKGSMPTYIDLVGRADLGPLGRARGAFRVRREALSYIGAGSAEVSASSGPLRAFRLSSCEGSAPLSSGSTRPSEGRLSCRYELVTARPIAERFGSMEAAKGRMALSAHSDGVNYGAALTADLDPITAWWKLTGGLALRARGSRGRPWKNATVSHELRVSGHVPHFEDLVAFLHDTKFAVPAPIHVLKGPLSLDLESRGDPRADRLLVHYSFSSDLTGPRQRLILRGTGDIAAVSPQAKKRHFEHSGELILKEVALELPRLDVGRMPKVLADKRITAGDEAPVVPATIRMTGPSWLHSSHLRIKTERPALLFSNLAKDPVPLALELDLWYPPAAATGRVSVQQFDVELFRRNATVDHLNVVLSSGAPAGQLEGLIRYRAPSATVNIVVRGTTDNPRIELTSVPPMKREDIIALLIFGKNPDELDAEQTASVSNTESALESRAFGLASLYLFGATPIEHVGYDSGTKTATVKVRLPGGANLSLGSDFDQNRQLSVRKPLAPHWAIQTEVTDQPQQSRAATTFLEWFNRY